MMEVRVVATNENLIPIENGELIVEIYVRFDPFFCAFLSYSLIVGRRS
jgi:hypothetical protein